MTEISFYHLKRHAMDRALLRLLEMSQKAGERAVVRLSSQEDVANMDTALWAVDPDSFLPHGTAKSSHPEDQPVFLTNTLDNPAKAAFLFVLPGASGENVSDFKRVFYVFDGNSENEVTKARENWKSLTKDGHDLTYWTQDESGKWAKK